MGQDRSLQFFKHSCTFFQIFFHPACDAPRPSENLGDTDKKGGVGGETQDLKPDIEHALIKKRTFQEKVEDKLILIDGPSDYE